MSTSSPKPAWPAITLDFDGVICRPPLGINVGISRNLHVPPLPESIEPRPLRDRRRVRGVVRLVLHVLRYAGRRPLPDARAGLLAIRERREPLLVTARGAAGLRFVESWLRRYGLFDCFGGIYANDTTLRAAQFKLHKVRALGAAEHVDDDGATAYYLARHGVPRVYLRDWPGNRGLPYPNSVLIVRSLVEVAEQLAANGNVG